MTAGGGLLAAWSDLLRPAGLRTALLASVLGRLSLGMTGLATLLLVEEATGSYAVAGACAAAYAVSFAAAAPGRARAADRDGPVRVLRTCALLHPVALVGLVLLARADVPGALLAVPAVLAGLTVPPLGPVMRNVWAERTTGDATTTAYALEAVVVELCFVLGPLLVAGLTAALGPSAALLAAAALVGVGGTALSRGPVVRAVRPHPERVHTLVGPLVSPAVRSLLLVVLCVGAGFGALEVALPAWVEEQGSRPAAAGVLLAVWSVGSIGGGLVYGALRPRTPPARQLPLLVGALAAGSLLPVLAPGPVLMGAALVLYGLAIAPYSTCNSLLLGAAAPSGSVTEAFAWSGSMIFGGAALGNVTAGVLVEQVSPTAALGATAAAGVAGLVVSLARRRVLV